MEFPYDRKRQFEEPFQHKEVKEVRDLGTKRESEDSRPKRKW